MPVQPPSVGALPNSRAWPRAWPRLLELRGGHGGIEFLLARFCLPVELPED